MSVIYDYVISTYNLFYIHCPSYSKDYGNIQDILVRLLCKTKKIFVEFYDFGNILFYDVTIFYKVSVLKSSYLVGYLITKLSRNSVEE